MPLVRCYQPLPQRSLVVSQLGLGGEPRYHQAQGPMLISRKLDCRKDLPVGTILVQSFGWEQTNISFFQVTEHVSRCKLKVQEIGAKTVENSTVSHGMADHCVADPDFKGKILEVRQDSKSSILVPGAQNYSWGSSAQMWDGKPRYRR